MKEKKIISQLNNFKSLKADKTWKEKNREILFSQISSGQNVLEKLSWFDNFKLQIQIIRNVSQPAMAAFLICLFIISGGVLSLEAARDTVPGDSLYIAKVVSEKTQLALTFNEKEKVRLGISFVSKRAEELDQVMNSNDKYSSEEVKQEQVKKTMDNFKKEISLVRTRVEKITPANQPVAPAESEEGGVMFSANLGKEEDGLQISDSPIESSEPALEDKTEVAPEISTSTEAVIEKNPDTKEILKQAEAYLETEDYGSILNKLEEADQAIGQVDSGEVKGVFDVATTTNP